ncbi:UDP-glucose 4-epimerase [Weizmannia acidilactici]|uniref:UDP-glucose 4-epimerase n=1 Tax=Weizmannia acidilactici TaxID=2607726 RepID=A0A5J4JPC9_9BACI|nr:NAD(P)-dependent oxidoreductase [Weizmannia acidilactici]GER70884.1 UDP-glucose 4-epimerase [Weizmannia acidilactici]
MDQVLVLGALQFAGFELCKALLDAGYPVMAADSKASGGIDGEKWMEIGRNANAIYQPTSELSVEGDFTCCLPVYDYYVQNAREDLQTVCSCLGNFSNRMERLALILPNHLAESTEKAGWIPRSLTDYIETMTFFVPTLYGPGQPSRMAFSQMINGNLDPDLQYDDRDALYAGDAAKAIVQVLEKGRTGKTFYLKSPDGNGWEPVARFLAKDGYGSRTLPENRLVSVREMEGITVQPSISYKEAISKQMAYMGKNIKTSN